MSDKNNQLMTIARQAKQGSSVGFADEIQDFIGAGGAYAVLEGLHAAGYKDQAPVFANLLASARTRSAEELAKDWEDNPATSIVGQIAGFVPFAIGQAGSRAIVAAGKSPAVIAKSAEKIVETTNKLQSWVSTGSRAARAGKGAVAGAGSGALSGFGASGDTVGERAQGTLLGTGIGSFGGLVGGAMSRGVLSNNQRALEAAKSASFNKAEMSFMRDLLMRPDLTELQKQNALYNAISKKTGIDLTLPERLAQTDIDPVLAQQGVLAKAPETAGAMQSILTKRMGDPLAGQSGQLVDAIQNTSKGLAQGSYDDLAQQLMAGAKESAGKITSGLKDKAGPLYNEAFQANKSIASPELDRILETPAGKKALAQARSILQNEGTRLGIPDKELGEIARELGIKSKGGIASGLKLQTYDLIKRGLDDMISNEISRSTPGTTSATARGLQSLKSRLVSELDKLDVTGITGPNSVRPDGGAYARARAVYSSQPETLGNREIMGNIAGIDKLSPERVVKELYSGTTGIAQRTAGALGPVNSKMAAAAKLQDIVGGLKTGNLPPKLDADTVNMLKIYAGNKSEDVTDLLRGVERARIGERYLRGSQTQANTDTASRMADAAGLAIDAASGGKTALVRKGVDAVGKFIGLKNGEQYNKDLLNVFTTDRGNELLQAAIKKHNELKGISPKATVALPTISGGSNLVSHMSASPDEIVVHPAPYAGAVLGAQAGGYANDYQPRGMIKKAQDSIEEYTPRGVFRRRQ